MNESAQPVGDASPPGSSGGSSRDPEAMRRRLHALEEEAAALRTELYGERPDSETLLHAMAEQTSRVFGSEFFRAFVETVAKLFRVREVLITELLPDESYRVRSVASWRASEAGEPFEYDVRWSPCEAVVRGDPVHHADRVQELFPRDQRLATSGAVSYCGVPLVTSDGDLVGHFCVSDDQPMPESICDVPIVKIHLARAAGELERRHVEEKLRSYRDEVAHVSRMSTIGELAAGIAHELNQPLAVITNYTGIAVDMARSDKIPLDDLHQVLEGADQAAHRASEIVKRLRVLVGRRSVQGDLVAMGELAKATIELLESELHHKKVAVELSVESNLPLVRADRIQIQQVILNLLKNGTDAMLASKNLDRRLEVRVSAQQDRVEIAVEDHGDGLDEQTLPHIFEPFYSTKNDGMGMGLAISRSIIESHGGRIWAETEGHGGTTFRVSLRVVERSESSPTGEAESS